MALGVGDVKADQNRACTVVEILRFLNSLAQGTRRTDLLANHTRSTITDILLVIVRVAGSGDRNHRGILLQPCTLRTISRFIR